MKLRVAAWNVESRLTAYLKGERGTPERILEGIAEFDADIIVLPEAYFTAPAEGVDKGLRRLGYRWHDITYGESDRDWSADFIGTMPTLRVLYRVPVYESTPVQWGRLRNMLTFKVKDEQSGAIIRFFAVHLDDRSETLRRQQVEDMIAFAKQETLPIVMMGDFNAMWHRGVARFYHSWPIRLLARCIPFIHIRNKAVQFSDMANGSTLAALARECGLRDADPKFRPTVTPKMRTALFMPSIPMGQIDHILISDSITASNVKVAPDRGSDHRGVSAVIEIK